MPDTNTENQIAARVREMREVMEFSPAEVASKLGIDLEQYQRYESGDTTFPVSTLYALAGIFGVDFTTLLTGEAPRMGGYTIVRAGKGVQVNRNPEYHFQSLAFNFRNRTMEPMLVYLEPHGDEDSEPALVTHGGQEFNLVLEGTVKVVVGSREFILNPGDSLYFDPSIPHGQRAVGGPVKFVTIINN